MENKMLLCAVEELAEHMGNSLENPLSVSLLCISFNINYDEKFLIANKFLNIVRNNRMEELNVNLFKDAIVAVSPQAIDFSELTVKAFIKAYSKFLVSELVDYAATLD